MLLNLEANNLILELDHIKINEIIIIILLEYLGY